MERIIDVYYGRDNLPYKDEARTIHFPVAGSEFLGASQTTTIRFHYEQIGTDENVYTVESKRPDGKTGSQLLSKNTTEHYAEMSLSGWYSECKGDLFLSLKVYRGGTTATYNKEAKLWEVNGVPVIESTGAIKLSINYTPMGRYEDYNDAISTYQDVLAALGDKLDTIKGIVGVSGLSQVDTTKYDEGQLFFNIDDKALYQLVKGSIVPFLEVYSKSETNDLLDKKADKSTTYTKTKIDDLLTDKQDKLVSGTNIKTINNISLLGSGNIEIEGGGGDAEWGSIGGDIADQTDLQNELQDIREVAEGKCKTYVINYKKKALTESYFTNGGKVYKTNGEEISTWVDFQTYVQNQGIANTEFNSQNDFISITQEYILTDENVVILPENSGLHDGDIILVTQTNVPDRWVYISDQTLVCSKLETSKVNLDNYSTKSETSTEVNKVAHDIAAEYDESTLYGSGDLCIKDKLLYKCNTNNTTGTWDSTKWDLTTVNSELGVIKGSYVDLTSAQTISGDKNHTGALQKNGVDVATIDQAFNVIKVSEMTDSTHFTQDQITLLSNGKPTRIVGSLGGKNNVFISSINDSGTYLDAIFSYANSDADKGISYCQITKANGYVIIRGNYIKFGINRIDINVDNGTTTSIYIQGKKLPDNPPNTGTFVPKCVNGVLTWVAE